jgi:hypothetical protein
MMKWGGVTGLSQLLHNDHEMYTMALVGYREERNRLAQVIAEIEAKLGGRKIASAAGHRGGMSDAGRQRIAEAQRKRWAALKKNKPASASPAPKHKRVLSAEGRRRIIEATKKRWAAYRKAAAAG